MVLLVKTPHIFHPLLLLLLLTANANPALAQNNAATSCIAAPQLPPPPADSIRVSTDQELRWAIGNIEDNTTIVIAPGTYNLTATISITSDLSLIHI